MKLADSHAHLTSPQIASKLDLVLEAATKNGVDLLINVACDMATSLLVAEQARQYSQVFAAVGIQPHDAKTFSELALENIKNLALTEKKVVALGEIGIDCFHNLSPLELQKQCFAGFLDLATELNLPVIVHMRDSFEFVYEMLRSRKQAGIKGVIHCYTGDAEQAKRILDLGFYISFSGIITFKNAGYLEEVIKVVPNDRFLIETDSPYLAPIPHRGKMNEPAFLMHTNECLARIKCQSAEMVANTSFANTCELFAKVKNHEIVSAYR